MDSQRLRHKLATLGLCLFLASCATNLPISSKDQGLSFQGRLLLFHGDQRLQLRMHARNVSRQQGLMRFSHALSARVIEVRWQDKTMFFRDNQASEQQWQGLSNAQLDSLGLLLRPAEWIELIQTHSLPQLVSHDQRNYRGTVRGQTLWVQWQKTRLVVQNFSSGKKAIMIFDHE